MKLRIVAQELLPNFKDAILFDVSQVLEKKANEPLPAPYFAFYQAISSVYSSKIEGETVDFDSFFKHKFLKIKFNPDYTKKPDDLFNAYQFAQEHRLNFKNVLKAHSVLSKHLLPSMHRGKLRQNPMVVLNEEDRIEYVVCSQYEIKKELNKLFDDIASLLEFDLTVVECFYYAAQIHLVFVKIHPFQDGNGRTARLLEKWFLLEKLGKVAAAVESEKNYFIYRTNYYDNIRVLGLEYENLNYSKAMNFLLMTISSLNK
jgi:Fic family protein